MTGQALRAGRVGRPHGLDGSFHVNGPNPRLLAVGVEVLIGGGRRRIVRLAGEERRPIVRLEGCDDREAAQGLQGEEMLVERAAAPELEPDEWWAQDLEGCRVFDHEHEVGVVSRLLALPSVDVLEVERKGEEALLVPLVADAVRRVDAEGRRIEVDLGFLGEA